MSSDRLHPVQRLWLAERADGEMGLWRLADDVREEMGPATPEDQVRAKTLSLLEPLLRSGELIAVDLFAGGRFFRRWKGTIEQQLHRIDWEWRALHDQPDIGEVVWFLAPEFATKADEIEIPIDEEMLRRDWVADARKSGISLWGIQCDLLEMVFLREPDFPTLLAETLRLLSPLILSGELRAAGPPKISQDDPMPDPAGISELWPGSPEDHLRRIATEWRKLGRPLERGEIARFVAPTPSKVNGERARPSC